MAKQFLRVLLVSSVMLAGALAAADEPIRVPSVLLKLIEQAEVPAREAGVLNKLEVREGDMVKEGAALAGVEDSDAQLDKRKAQLELVGATQLADNDVKIRFAKKSLEVADAELTRALDAEKRFPQSVSKTELAQLKLLVEKSTLEVEQAGHELDLARVTRDLKQNDVAIADHSIRQRQIMAPITGQVVEINRHRGEWVQPGQTILRILRLDRLRAEGLVPAAAVSGKLVGRPVKLTVKLSEKDKDTAEFDGVIVFVHPELDPVNGQVRVWAEVDNADLNLRPGLHGSMVIAGEGDSK
jgi:macrolide-specific efflux system membrane fusion protein